jgi:DHA1 family tetracycline resistance protein-like MFS transporter
MRRPAAARGSTSEPFLAREVCPAVTEQDLTRAPALAPVLLVNFIGTLGFSIVMPFLVFIVTRWGGNAFVYGLIEATYPLAQFVGAPVLGRWSDRFGRKRILLLSEAGTFLAWAIFAVALLLPVTELVQVRSSLTGAFTLTLPLLVLLGARAVDGLTGGNVSIANAYIADISTDESRNRNFRRMAVASNLGMILGPALAGLLGATPWGESLPVLLAMGISLVSCVLIATLLHSVPVLGAPCPSARSKACSVFGQEPRDCLAASSGAPAATREALRQTGVLFLLVLNFLLLLAFNFFYTAFPVHAAVGLHWTVVQTGAFFAVLSLLMVAVEGPVLAWLSRRVAEPWLVIAGCAVLGTNFLFMMARRSDLIYIGAALFALGNGIMWPSLESLTARAGGTRLQGTVQGLVSSAGSLAAIVGLVAGGLVFAWVGVGTFIFAAAFAYGSVALSFRLLRMTPDRDDGARGAGTPTART